MIGTGSRDIIVVVSQPPGLRPHQTLPQLGMKRHYRSQPRDAQLSPVDDDSWDGEMW